MKNKKSIFIRISGLVQGVGFRPFVYRLAIQHNIKGYVENTNTGVNILAEGDEDCLKNFCDDLIAKSPPASFINSILIEELTYKGYDNFAINKSSDSSSEITEVSPDITVCDDCLFDMIQQPHRINYPLINCTNCGPRFTIIQALPYDRDKTTMKDFVMCQKCQEEYKNILDRRFHAQPIACNYCGPKYYMIYQNKTFDELNLILHNVTYLLESGKILAIKGIGGYHLVCNALDETTTEILRKRKIREGKPFAVMFRNINIVRQFCDVSPEAEKLLLSWRRPIVILKQRKKLAKAVCNDFDTIGAMLPIMPFHYLMFDKTKLDVLVMTSGNISDEPIIKDDEKAVLKLNKIADAIVYYNRKIHNRADDSVISCTTEYPMIIRRSRGYVPSPIRVNMNVEGIFAAGAELNNTFAIGKSNQIILSQHIGDLKNAETFEFYEESFTRFKDLFRFQPDVAVCDLHPDYLSTKFATNLKIPFIKVQHHHSHIASVIAEHSIEDKVIGVAFDGTGLGDDGNIWGSEIMITDLMDYQRIFHYEYISLPGGDKVTKEPWRTAISLLWHIYRKDFINLNLPFLKKIPENKINLIIEILEKNIHCPLSCGAGRYFDAIAALSGICVEAQFHAEAPMRLEVAARKYVDDKAYPLSFKENQIIWKDAIANIVEDIISNVKPEIIASRFHNTVVESIIKSVISTSKESGIKKIVLSGGIFQNSIILDKVIKKLLSNSFKVFINNHISCNDSGISLGQAVIAAYKRA